MNELSASTTRAEEDDIGEVEEDEEIRIDDRHKLVPEGDDFRLVFEEYVKQCQEHD